MPDEQPSTIVISNPNNLLRVAKMDDALRQFVPTALQQTVTLAVTDEVNQDPPARTRRVSSERVGTAI